MTDLQRQAVSASNRRRATHGMARINQRSPEYNAWCHMKMRCENQNDRKFAEYGGRGIRVCARWDVFESFLADMGARPGPGYSLDRIDVNGHYEPSNCRWATPKEQSRNKRNHRLVEYKGRVMPLSEACEMAGVNYRSALWRLNQGTGWLPLPPTQEAK